MEEAERFAKDGYALFDRVFDPAFIDELRAEYLRQFPNVADSPDTYKVGHLRFQVPIRMTGPYLSPKLYANPVLLELAGAALGENYLIDSIATVTSLPGARIQHQHMDHEDLYKGQPFTRAVIGTYGLTVVIPLVDLTPETGTTKLFKGSHVKPVSEQEYELPHVERGRCFAMDYRLTHRGTENRSSAERPMIYLVYARPWFTDITNYGANDRIRIDGDDLAAVPEEYRVLFRRLSPERSGASVKSASCDAKLQ
jgi:hypothetical protein